MRGAAPNTTRRHTTVCRGEYSEAQRSRRPYFEEKLFVVFGGGFVALLLALLHHGFLWLFLGFFGLFALLCHGFLLEAGFRNRSWTDIPIDSITRRASVGNGSMKMFCVWVQVWGLALADVWAFA